MPEKEFLKELIRQTLKRVADLDCFTPERTGFCELILEHFATVSASILNFEADQDSEALKSGQRIWPAKHKVILTLFAEGLLEALQICMKSDYEEKILKSFMTDIGMELHNTALEIADRPKGDKKQVQPSEQQLQAMREQCRQQVEQHMSELNALYRNTDEPTLLAVQNTQFHQLHPARYWTFKRSWPWLFCKRTFWAVYEGRTKGFANFPPIASQRLPSAYTGIAWLGPFLIWWSLHTTAEEALISVPLIPVVGLGACLFWEWAKTGFFRLRAFPLLGLAGLNTVLLFGVEMDVRLTLLLNGLILLGMLCLYGLEQEHQSETEKTEAQKDALSETINPNRMYGKLELDRLDLQVGSELLCLADPDQDGQLLGKIAKLREVLTRELGYIIPNIRIRDSIHLDPNAYQFSIREIPVGTSKIYPGRYRISAQQYAAHQLENPEKFILDIDPVQTQQNVYWIKTEQIPEALQKVAVDATDALIMQVKAELIRHMDFVIDHQQVLKLNEYVRQQNSLLANNVLQTLLSVEEMRKLLVNLLREQVSVRDIVLIYERLSDYARDDQDPDSLCEKIRLVLKQRICADLKLKDKPLLALKLSVKLEKQILKACQANEDNRLERDIEAIDPTFCQEVRDKARPKIRRAEATHQATPAILCAGPVRLALFRILEKEFPFITVLAYPELTDAIQLEFLEEI